MPLMLKPENWDAWLGTPAKRLALLAKPFPAEETKMWPASRAVGNVRNEGPALVEPIEGASDDEA